MRSSYRLFRIRGIDIGLHVTLVILFLMPLLDLANGLGTAVYSFAFLVGLFSSVLVHELAHSLVAIRSGVKVKQIILTPIGGIASVGMVKDAVTELKISLAGPLVSLGIGAVLLIALVSSGGGDVGKALATGRFIEQPSLFNFALLLMYLNFVLGIFNLFVPIFPMDGGRVLRSMLCMITDKLKATRIAVYVGQAFLSMLFVFGLTGGSIWIMAIAVFLFIAGITELKLTETSEKLKKADLSGATITNFAVLHPDLELADFNRLAVGKQTLYPVLDDDGRPIGFLEKGTTGEGKVGDLMSRDFQTATLGDDKEELLSKVYSSGYAFIVDRKGILHGVLTMQNIQKVLKPAA
jgi:Zn-dependent protease